MGEDRVVTELTRLGGVAARRELERVVSGRRLRTALATGLVVRTRRGGYALPLVDAHRREAQALSGTVSHLSAAVAHGWAVKTPPDAAWVTVRRQRHLNPAGRRGAHVTWADLGVDDVARDVTTPLRTVLDCARRLPFDEALAVADSALRARDVSQHRLRTAAAACRGTGSARVRRVALHATDLAANPFESVLRAIAIDLTELDVRPQLAVAERGLWARVDLGDEQLRLALEAEGFAYHRTRKDLLRDAHRYTELTVHGWSVLRFTWEDVMLHPEWVRWAIQGWLATRAGREVPPPPTRAA